MANITRPKATGSVTSSQSQPSATQNIGAAIEPAPAPAPTDKWQENTGTSAMDDSPTVTYALTAEYDITGWLKTSRPALYVRCFEHKTAVLVHTDMAANVEYGGGHTVRIRLDDEPAFTEEWSESTNHEALFAPNPIALARRIARAKRMRFEFTPFNASRTTVEFDVTGFGNHIGEVANTCGWKP